MQGFERATGASADLSEIEYVSAIHQSTNSPRPDGAIAACDVQHFLLSRYGIRVSEEEVRETIIAGYGGADTEEECIDIAELTATMLIPYLFKATRSLIVPAGGKDSDSGCLKSDDCVVREVLRMILGDVTGSTTPVSLDRDLVRKILSTYGEEELAADDALVDDMLKAAGGEGGRIESGPTIMLDERAFARAIAGDVQRYPVGSELKITSNYDDVFPDRGKVELAAPSEDETKGDSIDQATNNSQGKEFRFVDDEESNTKRPPELLPLPRLDSQGELVNEPEEVATANGIDFISDTHRSKLFVVFLWAFIITTQRSYLPASILSLGAEECADKDFWCLIKGRVISWLLITAFYAIGGTLFITAGSWGNSFDAKRPWLPVASILLMSVATYLPVALIATDGQDQDHSEEYLSGVAVAFGSILVVLELIYLLGKYTKYAETVANKRGMRQLFAQLNLGNLIAESNVKVSATKKTHLIVRNALDVHGSTDEIDFVTNKSFSLALLNFGRRGEEFDKVGGLRWTWHQLLTGKLSKVEGVLIPSKLLAANIMQLIMSVFVTILLTITTRKAAAKAEDFVRENDPTGLLVDDALLANLVNSIRLSGYTGAGFSCVACLVLTLAYLPSIVRSTLQFRCGDIPSLGDTHFKKYMSAPDSVSKVPGSMFWAVFHAGVAVFFVVAVIIFLFAFDGTRNTAYNTVAQIIGFLIPTIFKLILLAIMRNRFYAGQYRRQPVSANYLGLALQCLDYALAFGYMMFRAVKLALTIVYYVGRTDAPVFTRKAGRVGPLDLDDAPIHFRKLIIGHEAHRHPYIETLGKMYLLKLRYREKFGTTCGSRWRMIFVTALMPWLRRYRVVFDTDNGSAANGRNFRAELERNFQPSGGSGNSVQPQSSRDGLSDQQSSKNERKLIGEATLNNGVESAGAGRQSPTFSTSGTAGSEKPVEYYSGGAVARIGMMNERAAFASPYPLQQPQPPTRQGSAVQLAQRHMIERRRAQREQRSPRDVHTDRRSKTKGPKINPGRTLGAYDEYVEDGRHSPHFAYVDTSHGETDEDTVYSGRAVGL